MNLKNAVDEWLRTKEIENVSQKTLSIYQNMTQELVDHVGNIPLREFKEKVVLDFLSYQRNREGRFGKLSDATLHKYYSVIRTFSIWLDDMEYVKRAPTDRVRAPRIESKLPECLTDDEVDELFGYLKARCSERMQLIFAFFLDTGARLEEVVKLDVDHVHLEDGWVKVYGKGRRERILPLGKQLKKDLTDYLTYIRPRLANEDEQALFVTKWGDRYKIEGMATLIKTKLKEIGVKGRYGPHKLRHTFATNYLRNQGGIEQLRIQMGHRDIKTTQRYLALVPDDIKRSHEVASPYDRVKERQ